VTSSEGGHYLHVKAERHDAVCMLRIAGELAREIIECARVLKGYGQTHQHGNESFGMLMDSARRLAGREDAAATLARLRAAALADEDGAALRGALADIDAAVVS
jgi:indolepyruvate ferredoxin oxidoreductase, beta subunit